MSRPRDTDAAGGADAGRWIRLGGVILASLGLVVVAVFSQLSARVNGAEYRFRVAPVDPIDPFRGAYVALSYPDLRPGSDRDDAGDDAGDGFGGDAGRSRGRLYIRLIVGPDGLMRTERYTRSRPDDGPYLTCTDRFSEVECGIESWFLPQDRATEWERSIRDGQAIATVRIDKRGNAALIDVRSPSDEDAGP
ncbi:MAG: GDYXXLXY domain-containing protein [Nocardioides sp.]